MPRPRGGGQPQSRRHSPTARSSQRHVPSATAARASQERKAEEEEGGGRSGQRSANRKKTGVKQVSAEVTRWKQRMSFSVLRLHHQKVCAPQTLTMLRERAKPQHVRHVGKSPKNQTCTRGDPAEESLTRSVTMRRRVTANKVRRTGERGRGGEAHVLVSEVKGQ